MSEYPKNYLKNMTANGLSNLLDVSRLDFAGGALFTKNKSVLSKTICSLTAKYSKFKHFIPSHVGSIILLDGVLYVFNMIPPKAYIQRLDDYLATTEDDFVIVARDFELDVTQFSKYLFNKIGEKYGYFSALQCGVKNISWIPNRTEHCSELHILALQQQHYFKNTIADDITPVECYEMLLNSIQSKNEECVNV